MDKRIEKELGEHIAEKQGWHWSLTRFMFDAYGSSIKDLIEREAKENYDSLN